MTWAIEENSYSQRRVAASVGMHSNPMLATNTYRTVYAGARNCIFDPAMVRVEGNLNGHWALVYQIKAKGMIYEREPRKLA